MTIESATGPPSSPSSTSQSKISPTRAARIGQRECLAAYGHCMSGSPSPTTGHYWPRTSHIRRVGLLSIPVMSCSSALPTPFGGFGLRCGRDAANGAKMRGSRQLRHGGASQSRETPGPGEEPGSFISKELRETEIKSTLPQIPYRGTPSAETLPDPHHSHLGGPAGLLLGHTGPGGDGTKDPS